MPPITVPAITIASDFDGPAKDGSAYRQLFTGRYDHRVLDGIGHDVPQEAPQEFANAIFYVAKYGGAPCAFCPPERSPISWRGHSHRWSSPPPNRVSDFCRSPAAPPPRRS